MSMSEDSTQFCSTWIQRVLIPSAPHSLSLLVMLLSFVSACVSHISQKWERAPAVLWHMECFGTYCWDVREESWWQLQRDEMKLCRNMEIWSISEVPQLEALIWQKFRLLIYGKQLRTWVKLVCWVICELCYQGAAHWPWRKWKGRTLSEELQRGSLWLHVFQERRVVVLLQISIMITFNGNV